MEKYVAACAGLKQNHPLGATMSYCNSGYTILGRLIEVLPGKSWDAVLREKLFEPLGLTTAGTLPEEALLHSAAEGHVTPPKETLAFAQLASQRWTCETDVGALPRGQHAGDVRVQIVAPVIGAAEADG